MTDFIGLDSETKTGGTPFIYANGTASLHPPGLDPRVSEITTVAIASTLGAEITLAGDERLILEQTPKLLTNLVERNGRYQQPVVVGWNIAFFDVPFFIVRSKKLGIDTTFRVAKRHSAYFPRPVEPKYGFPEWSYELPWANWENDLVWNQATMSGIYMVDLAPIFKQFCEEEDIVHSLKPVCAHFGIDMIEVDRTDMDALTTAERAAYCMSDTKGCLLLAQVAETEGLLTGWL